ncbi:MAG TPA: hypothetical protein VI036_13260, partial [Propionibacteriaceae bacterium]
VDHWWEHVLHNQSALRLKARLLFTPGVMVTSVPYHLTSPSNLDTNGAPSSSAINQRGVTRHQQRPPQDQNVPALR